MSQSRKRMESRQRSRIGANNSRAEVQVLQIIEIIVSRKLQIEDLIGTRWINRVRGVCQGPQIFRGMINLASLQAIFHFCLREMLEVGTTVIISESWGLKTRGVRNFFRHEGEATFKETKLPPSRYADEDLWGGEVPEAAQKEHKTWLDWAVSQP